MFIGNTSFKRLICFDSELKGRTFKLYYAVF